MRSNTCPLQHLFIFAFLPMYTVCRARTEITALDQILQFTKSKICAAPEGSHSLGLPANGATFFADKIENKPTAEINHTIIELQRQLITLINYADLLTANQKDQIVMAMQTTPSTTGLTAATFNEWLRLVSNAIRETDAPSNGEQAFEQPQPRI